MKDTGIVHKVLSIPLGVTVALWFVVYFLVRAVLEDDSLQQSTRIAVALLPIPFFILMLATFIRGIISMDELQKRIQLEALALAFPVTVLLLTTLGLVQRAVPLKLEDWSYNHVSFMVAAIYFISIGFASGRYR